MVMGCRIALYVCQHTTDVVTYIHSMLGYFLLNYVNDSISAEFCSVVSVDHGALIRTLCNVRIQRLECKSVTPTQITEFLGNLFESNRMTIGVTPTCKTEIMKELERWRTRDTCTHRQLESLIGKLQFMGNCIRPGRLLLSCLLSELKSMRRDRVYRINAELRKDLRWWYLFLPTFKGEGILWLQDVMEVDSKMAIDACL